MFLGDAFVYDSCWNTVTEVTHHRNTDDAWQTLKVTGRRFHTSPFHSPGPVSTYDSRPLQSPEQERPHQAASITDLPSRCGGPRSPGRPAAPGPHGPAPLPPRHLPPLFSQRRRPPAEERAINALCSKECPGLAKEAGRPRQGKARQGGRVLRSAVMSGSERRRPAGR